MKNNIKESIVSLLIWACIIWIVAFDPSQFGNWIKVAICLGSITAFFWWIFDFNELCIKDDDETERV